MLATIEAPTVLGGPGTFTLLPNEKAHKESESGHYWLYKSSLKPVLSTVGASIITHLMAHFFSNIAM